MSAILPSSGSALPVAVQEQVKAELNAGNPVSAEDVREMMHAQALLDARQSPSVILMGEMGSGKTHALRSLLVDANGKFEGPSVSGIERVMMLNNEGGFEDVLGDIPATKLGWNYVPVSEGSFDGLLQMVRTINTQHPDAIQKMGGINKSAYREFEKLLGVCVKFVDQRTGKDYGDVTKFPTNWCFWYESISALSEIAKNNAIGDKPFMEPRDYQMVQNSVRKFINHCVFSTKCLFVATAHVERESNPSTGMSEMMVSTVGKALPPILPRFFSDVILTTRVDDVGGSPKFFWHTASPMVRTKTRNLPWAQNLPANFTPLLDNFRKRQQKGK